MRSSTILFRILGAIMQDPGCQSSGCIKHFHPFRETLLLLSKLSHAKLSLHVLFQSNSPCVARAGVSPCIYTVVNPALTSSSFSSPQRHSLQVSSHPLHSCRPVRPKNPLFYHHLLLPKFNSLLLRSVHCTSLGSFARTITHTHFSLFQGIKKSKSNQSKCSSPP